jgi:hypothetical protein
VNRRPEIAIVAPNASAEEAAAVVAALAQFMRNHAPVVVHDAPEPSPWKQAALHEGVVRGPDFPPFWA